MEPIDLKDYAIHEIKISTQELIHSGQSHVETKTWKVLAAHFIDFYISITSTIFMYQIINIFIANLMPTEELSFALSSINSFGIIMSCFPLILTSYFFFCNFLNHGQSVGMSMLKIRIDLPQYDFRNSLRWAFYSTLTIVTAGVSFFITKNELQNLLNGRFKIQDYLHQELMEDKVIYPVDLIAKTKESIPKKSEEMPDFKQAA